MKTAGDDKSKLSLVGGEGEQREIGGRLSAANSQLSRRRRARAVKQLGADWLSDETQRLECATHQGESAVLNIFYETRTPGRTVHSTRILAGIQAGQRGYRNELRQQFQGHD